MVDQTHSWLSLEDAAKLVSSDLDKLQSYLNHPNPEKQFQPHGLMFDRKRYEAGEHKFLQPLEVPTHEPTTQQPSSSSQENDTDVRSYQWNKALIRLQIIWQPVSLPEDDRKVLISATTHDDFPISLLINESELGELPFVIQQLLDELGHELPARQLRYQAKNKKSKPASSTTKAPQKTHSQPVLESKSDKPKLEQISIFGI